MRPDLPDAAAAALGSFTIASPPGTYPGEWHLLSASEGVVATGLSGDAMLASVQVQGGRLLGAAREDAGTWHVGTLDSQGRWTQYATRTARADGWVDPTGRWLLITDNAGALGVELIALSGGEAVALPRPSGVLRGYAAEVDWSPTGNTAVVPDCDQVTCTVMVVTTADGAVSTIDDFAPRAASDTWVVGHRDTSDVRWVAHNVASGERRVLGSDLITGAYSAYALPDGTFVISGTNGPRFVIAIADPETGAARLVHESVETQAWSPYLFPLSTDPHWAVVGPRDTYGSVIAGLAGFAMLDLDTGELLEDAAVVSVTN